jgi:hypothetical protein
MTTETPDREDSKRLDSPTIDELAERHPTDTERAEQALRTAYEYHDALDRMKTWALDAAVVVREIDPTAASYVESVFWRIETGDRERARQPRMTQHGDGR